MEKLQRKFNRCIRNLKKEQGKIAIQKEDNDRLAETLFIRSESIRERREARQVAEQLHKLLNERNAANQELQEENNWFNYQIVQVNQEIEEAKARIKSLDDPKVRK